MPFVRKSTLPSLNTASLTCSGAGDLASRATSPRNSAGLANAVFWGLALVPPKTQMPGVFASLSGIQRLTGNCGIELSATCTAPPVCVTSDGNPISLVLV